MFKAHAPVFIGVCKVISNEIELTGATSADEKHEVDLS